MFCPSCGTQNPQSARFCTSCGAALPTNPQDVAVAETSAPTGSLPTEAAASAADQKTIAGRRIASLGDRFIALILDGLLWIAAFAVIGMWAALRWGGVTANGFELLGKPAALAMAAVLVLGLLYHWLLEASAGATIGKGIVGIRVCNEQGRRCGLGPSLIRNILRLIDGLAVYLVGFLIALFSKRRQRLGDRLANTYVVDRETGPIARAVLVLLWLALLAGGVLGAMMLHRRAPAGSAVTEQKAEETAAGSVTRSDGLLFPPVVTSGDLKLINFRFTEKEDGPPRDAVPYRHKDRIRAEWELAGYTTDAQGRTDLDYDIAVTDPNGVGLYGVQEKMNQAVGEAKPIPMYFWLDLPGFAPRGNYRVEIKVQDNLKNTTGRLTAGFSVEADPLPISSELEIRDLHLAASENGPPLDPAVVQPGATVYMSGKLAGMTFRDDQVDLQLSFQVFGPDGEKLMDKPDFLTIKDSFSYRPATIFLPISGHLGLPADIAKGRYTERYTLTDRIGGASRIYELTFDVQ